MLEVNLLPWREQDRECKKRWFFIKSLLLIFVAIVICIGLHTYYSRKLSILQDNVTNVTSQLEKSMDPPIGNDSKKTQEIIKKIVFNQDQLKFLIYAMGIHSKIIWHVLDIQNKKITVNGYVDQMAPFIHFIEYCRTARYLQPVIKNIKINSKLNAIEFQVQFNRE